MPQFNLARKELPGFQGVNLRQDRLTLADAELAKAINADLHTFFGVIVLRLGRRKQFSSALTDLVIRRIARINNYRYQVAGTSVYRDQSVIINGLLSDKLFTTMMPFRPLLDTKIWTFIADNNLMRKDNGTTTMVWGIRKPTDEFEAVESVANAYYGDADKTVLVTYTFVRFDGESVAAEGNPADEAEVTFTEDDTAVWIGDIEDPGTTVANGFGFYRTVIGGSQPLLDTRASFGGHTTWNNTWAFTYAWEASHTTPDLAHHFTYNAGEDYRSTQQWGPYGTGDSEDANGYHATHNWEINDDSITQELRFTFGFVKEDDELSAALEFDNDPPPNAAWVAEFNETAFFCRDTDNPHYLWHSKRFLPEAVPSDNFLEIGNADDPLQCAIKNAGLLGVFTIRTKYRVTGNAAGYIAEEALSHRGTPAPAACLPSEYGVIFPARDGIFLTNLISTDQPIGEELEPLFYGETVNGLSPINWEVISKASAEVHKGRYYFAYPSGTNTDPDMIAVFSQQTKKWYFYDHPVNSLFLEAETAQLTAGSADGLVYVLEEGNDDAGTDIELDVETRDFAGEERDTRKLFLYFRVDADTQDDDLTIKFYVDGTLKRTTTINGNRNKPLLRLPEGSMGYQWRIGFSYTGTERIKIYGCSALWAPMSAM